PWYSLYPRSEIFLLFSSHSQYRNPRLRYMSRTDEAPLVQTADRNPVPATTFVKTKTAHVGRFCFGENNPLRFGVHRISRKCYLAIHLSQEYLAADGRQAHYRIRPV